MGFASNARSAAVLARCAREVERQFAALPVGVAASDQADSNKIHDRSKCVLDALSSALLGAPQPLPREPSRQAADADRDLPYYVSFLQELGKIRFVRPVLPDDLKNRMTEGKCDYAAEIAFRFDSAVALNQCVSLSLSSSDRWLVLTQKPFVLLDQQVAERLPVSALDALGVWRSSAKGASIEPVLDHMAYEVLKFLNARGDFRNGDPDSMEAAAIQGQIIDALRGVTMVPVRGRGIVPWRSMIFDDGEGCSADFVPVPNKYREFEALFLALGVHRPDLLASGIKVRAQGHLKGVRAGQLAKLRLANSSAGGPDGLPIAASRADVCYTVGPEKERVYAHSFVLEDCPHFGAAFRLRGAASGSSFLSPPLDHFEDFSRRAFCALLYYIYTESLPEASAADELEDQPWPGELTPDEAVQLLAASHIYGNAHFRETVEVYIGDVQRGMVTRETVAHLLEAAREYGADQLERHCVDRMQEIFEFGSED
eukprot:tig00000361_g24367.t1